MRRQLIIALFFAALVPVLAAQRGGSRGGGFNGGFHVGFTGNRAGRYGGYPAFWGDPFFDADYPYPSLAYQAPAQPVVVVQQTTAAAPADPERLPESVLIEWQGNRYVRSIGDHTSDISQDYSEAGSRAGTQQPVAQAAPSELPPTILIYRDGHREEIVDYVIASGNLYARGDYYRDGYWSKNIQLASLDIPATLKANERTGVRFILPSAPNEIVTRP